MLRFLFTGKFCMVMQDLTVVYSEILAELSTSNLPVVDTESFGEFVHVLIVQLSGFAIV